MSSANNYKVISQASPHTIKKFELIEKYVESWAHILLQNSLCHDLIFIDCMCNSGEYTSEDEKTIVGTPVRASRILSDAAKKYPNKNIRIILNDNNSEKINHLKKIVDAKEEKNFKTIFKNEDANALLKRLGPGIQRLKNVHCLLIYDPYDASIDWDAVSPFINSWSEVIINHMVSDPARAIGVAKKESTKQKYEKSYRTPFESLIPYGTDKNAYEKRVHEIINEINKNHKRDYYISSFPFFIRTNNIEYNLIHCTRHSKGFNLFKTTAWKTFDGRSSQKNLHGMENQLVIDDGIITSITDQSCYTLDNVADYLYGIFDGRDDVKLEELWEALAVHPVFPSDGFKKDIKGILKNKYQVVFTKSRVSFYAGDNK